MIARRVRFGPMLFAGTLAALGAACRDDDTHGAPPPATFGFDTTRLCAPRLARDAADAAFLPHRRCGCSAPISAGRTSGGLLTSLRRQLAAHRQLALQPNDDSLGTLEKPANDGPGFDHPRSDPGWTVPRHHLRGGPGGHRVCADRAPRCGEPVPLGPLNTPVTGFFDGEREWAAFIVAAASPAPRRSRRPARLPRDAVAAGGRSEVRLRQQPAAVSRPDR